MTSSLKVFSPSEPRKLLVELIEENDKIHRGEVAEEMQAQVDRWLAQGLRQLVREGGRVVPRVTLPTEKQFFARLAEAIQAQTRLGVEIQL